MRSLQIFTTAATIMTLGLIVLMNPTIYAGDNLNCIATDVKGHFNHDGKNFTTDNPVTGVLENVADNPECSDRVYVHIFGSNNPEPHDGDWLTTQTHVTTHTFDVPEKTASGPGTLNISIPVPESDFCWYQIDAVKTDSLVPNTYNGADIMVDYVLVKNKDCSRVTPTPTPTATPSATPTVTVTPTEKPKDTPTPTPKHEEHHEKTVESVRATMGTTTMAETGSISDMVVNGSLITGMIVSALGAFSYAKDKRSSSIL